MGEMQKNASLSKIKLKSKEFWNVTLLFSMFGIRGFAIRGSFTERNYRE